MVVDSRRFGGTYRLLVHSSLLFSVSIPEDIELQTIESQRHEIWNTSGSSAAARYLSYDRIPSNVIHCSSWKISQSSRPWLTLEDVSDRLSRNVNYQSTLRSIPKRAKSGGALKLRLSRCYNRTDGLTYRSRHSTGMCGISTSCIRRPDRRETWLHFRSASPSRSPLELKRLEIRAGVSYSVPQQTRRCCLSVQLPSSQRDTSSSA